MEAPDVRVLLVIGTYGSGKTTLVEELAELLEERGEAFGAIDLDWLMWFHVADMTEAQSRAVFTRNLAAVVHEYLDAGARYVLVAGAVRDRAELDAIVRAVGAQVRVVRLLVPLEEIERRLAGAVTTGRQRDLRESPDILAGQQAAAVDALEFANQGDVRELALRVVDALGW